MSEVGDSRSALKPIVEIVGDAPVALWGMTSAERLRRSFERAGIVEAGSTPAERADPRPRIVARADFVFDQRLIEALIRSPDTALVTEGGAAVAAHSADPGVLRAVAEHGDRARLAAAGAVRIVSPVELGGDYNQKLRKREIPFLLPLTPETLPEIRDRTFQASYKGVTDFITKHVWPPPAKLVTRWCADCGITPNQVTLASLALVILAFWLFSIGAFAAGLVAAWVMTFLDTVDGKLARVTMTYSKAGDVLDHGIDLVHPPFWWWAWILGLDATGQFLPHRDLVLAVVVGGYVAQRIEEGVFIKFFGIEMHIWRRFDSWFRGITARRNPNLLILTLAALAGRPDWGMLLVAAWTAACFLVHLAQIVQAGLAARRGPITSWLAA